MAKILFYLCDRCKAINYIPPMIESSLQYVQGVECFECKHIDFKIKELKEYAKKTGVIE